MSQSFVDILVLFLFQFMNPTHALPKTEKLPRSKEEKKEFAQMGFILEFQENHNKSCKEGIAEGRPFLSLIFFTNSPALEVGSRGSPDTGCQGSKRS